MEPIKEFQGADPKLSVRRRAVAGADEIEETPVTVIFIVGDRRAHQQMLDASLATSEYALPSRRAVKPMRLATAAAFTSVVDRLVQAM